MRSYLTGSAVAFLLTAVAAGNLSLAAQAEMPEMVMHTKQKPGGLPPPRGRLKFKSSGPVCMCAEGMSERDIERAMEKLKAAKNSKLDSDTKSGQEKNQESYINPGVTK